MIVDCHVHSGGDDDAGTILAAMDEAGIDVIFLFSYEYITEEQKLWPELERVAAVCAEAPDRLYPFALIDPRFDDAPGILDRAVNKLGYRGLKMLPNHWYPYDEVAMRMYAKMQELGIPGIFHAGILYGQIYVDSSRFCQPVHFEALLHYPDVKFGLAHMGAPWCRECVSVLRRFGNYHYQRGSKHQQMFIDITPGNITPADMSNALARAGAQHIVHGSDTNTGRQEGLGGLKRTLESRRQLFCELGVAKEDQAAIFGETVLSWFK